MGRSLPEEEYRPPLGKLEPVRGSSVGEGRRPCPAEEVEEDLGSLGTDTAMARPPCAGTFSLSMDREAPRRRNAEERVTHRSPRHDAAISALSRAGWDRISDRIIHGLCHDLSGRASSLTGLTYLLESRDEEASSLLPLVGAELARMEDAVRLLRLLPDDATEPELMAPGELLGDLALLVGVQRGLENVPVRVQSTPGAPAVRMDRTVFIRSLVLLFTKAAEIAGASGRREVVARATPEGTRLILELTPGPWDGETFSGGSGETDGLPDSGVLAEGSMEALGEAFQLMGIETGEFAGGEEGRVLRVRYPSPESSGSF